MKIKVEICPVCRKEECSGRIFITPVMYGMGQELGRKTVCINDPNVGKEKNGKFYYELIVGHGHSSKYELVEL